MATIKEPQELRENTYLPTYQTLAGLDATIPARTVGSSYFPAPILAITNAQEGVSWASLKAKGVTHMQRSMTGRPEFADVPFSDQYGNYQYKTPQGGSLPPLASQAEVNTWVDANLTFPAGKTTHVYTNEFDENGIGGDANTEFANQRVYSKLGVSAPNRCNLFGGYGRDSFLNFAPRLTVAKANSNKYAVLRSFLASRQNAKSAWADDNQGFRVAGLHHYYATGADTYRNRMVQLYMNSRFNFNSFIYQLIFEAEKWNMGDEWKKTAAYTWNNYEALDLGVDFKVRETAAHFASPPGALYRYTPGMQMSYSNAVDMSVIFHLLCNGVVEWDANEVWSTSMANWSNGLSNDVYWKPDGGSLVPWTGGAGQPTKSGVGNKWPGSHQAPAANGLYAGRWLVAAVKGRIETLEYVPYTYSVNGGGSQNGYKGGANPQDSGNNYGLAYVNRYGLSNAGQYNSVDNFEAARPIGWWGEGPDGYVFIGRNPNAMPDENTVFTISKYGTKTATATGTDWVFETFN